MNTQSFSSLLLRNNKGETVWWAALGFSSLIHFGLFQGLEMGPAKLEPKPARTIISLKKILPASPVSLLFPKLAPSQDTTPKVASGDDIVPALEIPSKLIEPLTFSSSPQLKSPLPSPEATPKPPQNFRFRDLATATSIEHKSEPGIKLQLELESNIKAKPDLSKKSDVQTPGSLSTELEKDYLETQKKIAADEKKNLEAAKLERRRLMASEKAAAAEKLRIAENKKTLEATKLERITAEQKEKQERLRVADEKKALKDAEIAGRHLETKKKVEAGRLTETEKKRKQSHREAKKVEITPREEAVLQAIRKRYERDLVSELERYKKYPRSAQRRGYQSVIRITFRMTALGELVSYKLETPSQHEVLNRAVIEMIQQAFPLSSVPEVLREAQKEFKYTLPIEFRL